VKLPGHHNRSKSNRPKIKTSLHTHQEGELLPFQKVILSPKVERTLEKSGSLKALRANQTVMRIIHDKYNRLYG
jgi:hypothetical protein